MHREVVGKVPAGLAEVASHWEEVRGERKNRALLWPSTLRAVPRMVPVPFLPIAQGHLQQDDKEREKAPSHRKASDPRSRRCGRKARPAWGDVPEGQTAEQLANLYSEWLEDMPADVDLVGVYVGSNRLNIVANDDAVWELPDKAEPT